MLRETGEPLLVQVDQCNGLGVDTKSRLAPPPFLPSLLFCSDSDKNNAMGLVRGPQWHPYRRDILISRSIFPQVYVPPSLLIKFNLLYRRLLFRSEYLSPPYRSQIWLADSTSSPPVGSRKSPGPNLYQTHQYGIELQSKSAQLHQNLHSG
jgi:hypothetical protein